MQFHSLQKTSPVKWPDNFRRHYGRASKKLNKTGILSFDKGLEMCGALYAAKKKATPEGAASNNIHFGRKILLKS